MMFDTDDDKFAALAVRDPRANGQFVVMVKTTGIYCRPTCSARTPKKINVSYAATPDEARAQGYRACKRCTPDTVV